MVSYGPPQLPGVNTSKEDNLSREELLSNVSMHPNDFSKIKVRTDEGSGTIKEQTSPQMTPEEIESIIRTQSRDIIEKIVWKLVPDLADSIIREEIKRLMGDSKF